MLPQFDNLKQTVFSHILSVMGEDAVWVSSSGEETTGQILFNYPTQPDKIGDTDQYQTEPITPTAEYYTDTFEGLKADADTQIDGYLLIRGQKYFVLSVQTKYDGDTYIANLELSNE